MKTQNLIFVWTQRAVDRYIARGICDPRHTSRGHEYNLDSPWLQNDWSQRSGGSAWILISSGRIVADGPHSV